MRFSLSAASFALMGLAFPAIAPPASFAATITVAVGDNFFSPANVTINQGDVIRWNWVGSAPHSVRSGDCAPGCAFDGLFSSGSSQNSGHFTSQPFNAPGSFPYFCGVHLASMTGTITVSAAAPLVSSPMSDRPVGNPPLSVQFMANPSGGVPPYAFSWDFDDGSQLDASENPQHVFNALGTFAVQVTVTDSLSSTAQGSAPIIVTDMTCSATADPNAGVSPLDVLLTGAASGGDPNYAFMWDLGDGSPMAMGESVMHSYLLSGPKHVMLMVEDSLQVPCAAPVLVNVIDPNCLAGDADADGICDDADNCPGLDNPGQEDGDGDGVGDACDDCPSAPDPAQIDTDQDGAGDACDLTVTSPLQGAILAGCSSAHPTPPVIQWTPERFDRFRVLVSWDPGFAAHTFVTSGDRLLRTTVWSPPVRKWKKACRNALAAGQTLFVEVFGKDTPTRETTFSDPVQVTVTP